MTQDSDREEARQFLLRYHKASDSLDAKQIEPFYHEDAKLRFANTPTVTGRDNIRENFSHGFTLFE